MKDFDVVKFTLWMGVILLVAVLGGKYWVAGKLEEEQSRLRRMKTMLKEIGELSGQIDFREQELEDDKFIKYENTPATFFQQCAGRAGVNSRDFKFKAKDPDENPAGYKDQVMTLDLTNNYNRQRLGSFCYSVEAESPRVKLVGLDLSLEHNRAEQDLWSAKFTFLRRDPLSRN